MKHLNFSFRLRPLRLKKIVSIGYWLLNSSEQACPSFAFPNLRRFSSFIGLFCLLIFVNPAQAQNYGMRDDGGVNLPTVTYWYSEQASNITEKGAQFNGKNFGVIQNFEFRGASIKVWKTAGGDVTGAQFKYKVWKQGNAEPDEYVVRNIGWSSNDEEGTYVLQTWANFGSPIEITTGLVGGIYNVKILFSITGTGVPGITENGPFSAIFEIPTVSSAAEILSFVLAEQSAPATINSANSTVTISVVHGTSLTALTPSITVSAGATISPASGQPQNFSNPVQYTVTAQDGITTKMWTVTVTVSPPKYSVTFNVDMTPAVAANQFNPATDSVDIGANFNNWSGGGAMVSQGNNIYSLQTSAIFEEGEVISYKYRINGSWATSEFPSGDNRFYTVVAGTNTINDVYNRRITFANLEWPSSTAVEIGASVDIYSQVTVENATIGSNGVEGMQVWVGIHTENTNPSGWTQWNLATWNGLGMYSNRPEYKYTLNTTGMAEGTYYYANRFKLGNGEYVYGGYSSTGGGYWDGTNNVSGVLTLQQQIQTFPVTFTVTNENPAVTMIYIKGSFNGWTEVAMENSGGNQWTKTFNIPAGNYEWGITDQNQVWLLPSSQNLTFSVSATGVITGQTSYTVQGGGTGNASILDRWIIYQGSQVVYVGGSEFNGSQLGAFNTNQSLILKGAGLKTFKEGIYDITGASIFYRVHPVGNATGSYQVVNLPWKENLPEAGQQVWEEAEQNINLINGLAPGQYQIEIYFEAYYKIGDQTAIYTFVDNNNGNNYSAGFTVSQTTGINDLGAEIRFFPNPVSDLLIVSTKSKLESIEVFDFNGNLLGRTNESEIRLSHLVNGLYIVKIVTESEVLYGKVLKSN